MKYQDRAPLEHAVCVSALLLSRSPAPECRRRGSAANAEPLPAPDPVWTCWEGEREWGSGTTAAGGAALSNRDWKWHPGTATGTAWKTPGNSLGTTWEPTQAPTLGNQPRNFPSTAWEPPGNSLGTQPRNSPGTTWECIQGTTSGTYPMNLPKTSWEPSLESAQEPPAGNYLGTLSGICPGTTQKPTPGTSLKLPRNHPGTCLGNPQQEPPGNLARNPSQELP